LFDFGLGRRPGSVIVGTSPAPLFDIDSLALRNAVTFECGDMNSESVGIKGGDAIR